MTSEKHEGPDHIPRTDETDRRDAVRDQDELEHARGWRHSPAERRKDLLPGTRAWRTDHTEVALVESPYQYNEFHGAAPASKAQE